MLLGAGTGHILQLTNDAAGDLRVSASLVVTDTSNPPVVQGSANTGPVLLASITTATTTALVTGVSSRLIRVDEMSVHNASTSVVQNITVKRTDGTNTPSVIPATLLPGETLQYGGGQWVHKDSNGGIYGATPKLDVCVRVTSDVTNATTSFADVTGLTVALKSGKTYAFEAFLHHINNATTTGSRFGVNIGATPTQLIVSTIDTVTASPTASTHSAGSVAALDTAITAQTTGSAAITMAVIAGLIQPSADGTFAIRCASEVAVASGIIVKAGSWLRVRETDN